MSELLSALGIRAAVSRSTEQMLRAAEEIGLNEKEGPVERVTVTMARRVDRGYRVYEPGQEVQMLAQEAEAIRRTFGPDVFGETPAAPAAPPPSPEPKAAEVTREDAPHRGSVPGAPPARNAKDRRFRSGDATKR